MRTKASFLVGIAGPSCSGKTALARQVAESLEAATFLSLDDYYFDLAGIAPAERCQRNYDLPDAIDHKLLELHLRTLIKGRGVKRPVYDFTTHTRATQGVWVRASRIVIVEGLFALYWREIRELLDAKIFVETLDHVCFERRLRRDVQERGRSTEDVKGRYESATRPMYERFVAPTRQLADLIVRGEDPFQRTSQTVSAFILNRTTSLLERGREMIGTVSSRRLQQHEMK